MNTSCSLTVTAALWQCLSRLTVLHPFVRTPLVRVSVVRNFGYMQSFTTGIAGPDG